MTQLAESSLDVTAIRAKFERERRARLGAEKIAEHATRELFDRQQDLVVLEAIAAAANEAVDVREALQVTVDAVCERSSWPIGHAFLLDPDDDLLHPTGVWHLEQPERYECFRELTATSLFERGSGIPGRVFESGEPLWIPNARADQSLPRAAAIEGSGINASFAFPILVGDAVAGVVEFFSPSLAEPDDRLIELVGQVGVVLGRVVERDRNADERQSRSRELQRYAAELERANDELREFAYVASHDLSEPLRTISGFVRILQQRYEGDLDESADEFIAFIVDGTERMQALIRDLLSYSKAGRAELELQEVDLTERAHQAAAAVSALIGEAGATVGISELPVVMADPAQIDRLFTNLLSNAVKFRRDEAPRVSVSAERGDGIWTIRVADNGIGIEERHRERVFNAFHRLHGRADFEGTGIGLAICKRIVERHGGAIRVEETEGGGATFAFEFPDPQTGGEG